MGEQLQMQKEDYEIAAEKGNIYVCKSCGALTISDCEDVIKGVCFYCGSKDISWDKKQVKTTLKKRIADGAL